MNPSEDLQFTIFDDSSHAYVKISPLNIPNTDTSASERWIRCKIEVQTKHFYGTFTSEIMAGEFESLKIEVNALKADYNKSIEFTTMENGISLSIQGDGLGHFNAMCTANPDPIPLESLSFEIQFDQTMLDRMERELSSIINTCK